MTLMTQHYGLPIIELKTELTGEYSGSSFTTELSCGDKNRAARVLFVWLSGNKLAVLSNGSQHSHPTHTEDQLKVDPCALTEETHKEIQDD